MRQGWSRLLRPPKVLRRPDLSERHLLPGDPGVRGRLLPSRLYLPGRRLRRSRKRYSGWLPEQSGTLQRRLH